MSRFSKYSKTNITNHNKYKDQRVENFMGGTSYIINPIDTLKMVAASSIFGEPSYYRRNETGSNSYLKNISKLNSDYNILSFVYDDTSIKTTDDVFVKVIDNALDYDFAETLKFAVRLRNEFYMRLNPSVIFIRAAIHPKRAEFTKNNPEFMKNIADQIIKIPNDMNNQLDYYCYINGTKNKLPSIVKRAWKRAIESKFGLYHFNKYKSGLIDIVRISHPSGNKNTLINDLIHDKLMVPDDKKTWEQYRSSGMKWNDIINKMGLKSFPHMALLRNLRGIFSEISDTETVVKVLEHLKSGVVRGKQFPFRYYSAYNAIMFESTVNHRGLILDALQECIDISMKNFPKLNGKTICLSDNSGSAWGSLNSEYGTVRVADIANLSSLMTSYNSDEGYVGVFGDRLQIIPVSKRDGILSQHERINKHGKKQGMGTENGIWMFFRDALANKIHYDNIFIYSDMQAGHGGLYGINPSEYSGFIPKNSHRHIDVLGLVQEYRRKVNPKVNVFTVQVAGYDNSVLPENLYRGAILSGWTGKEAVYAKELIELWNSIESNKQ